MKIHTFIADSAAEAVAQIREELGPDAVVLNVRKVEANGLNKLWKKAQIEVVAHLPEAPEPAPDPLHALSELRREIADLREQIPTRAQQPIVAHKPVNIAPSEPAPKSRIDYGAWKIGSILEHAGLLPRTVQQVIDEAHARFGEDVPEAIAKQFDLVRAVIGERNQNLLTSISTSGGMHIFVGPPGSGKTTVLSKRLAQIALIENMPARVLRLDGARANTAESLSVYCEILGVEVDRCHPSDLNPHTTTFIDLPGVSANDSEGLRVLATQLGAFPGAQIHLTLNAAYETTTLLNQLRAYSALPIHDLVFTHLDEETRWGKMLNFSFGTKVPIALFSAGQNVPGELFLPSIEKILSRVIPSK